MLARPARADPSPSPRATTAPTPALPIEDYDDLNAGRRPPA